MKLYKHQLQGIEWLKNHRRSILADEQGTGKTCQVLKVCEELLKPDERCLIVVPKTVRNVWEEEVQKWTSREALVLDGTPAKRRSQLANASGYRYIVVGYEALRQDIEHFVKQPWHAIVFDEAHKLKNRKTRIFKAAKVLCRKNCDSLLYCLTGTPILNAAQDVWTLLHLIDSKTYSSFWRWAETYLVIRPMATTTAMWTEVGGPKNIDEFRDSLKGVLLRRRKDEVLDLPPRVYQTVTVDMEGSQLSAYRTMRDRMFVDIENGTVVDAPSILAQITRLRQICVSRDLLNPDTDEIRGAKIDALMDLLEGVCYKGVIVYTSFAQAAKRIYKRIPNASLLIGELSTNERNYELAKFRDTNGVLIATTQCGGLGLNLTNATTVIMLDLPWHMGLVAQAVDRVHRIGQKQSTTVYTLQAKQSVDTWVSRLVNAKDRLAEAVLEQIKKEG